MGSFRMRVRMLALILIATAAAGARDEAQALANFAGAKTVIGQASPKNRACNRGAANPAANTICEGEGGPALGGNILYVPDSGNSRVLGFNQIPKKNGTAASFVLGEPDFSTVNFDVGRAFFDFPARVLAAGNKLFVADFSNSRVLIWNTLPTTTGALPDVVVGQPGFNSSSAATTQSGLNLPENGLAVAGGKLFVADRSNNRILIWNSIPVSNGANADLVLGQSDFTHSFPATSQTGLREPEGLWTDGTRLVVADFGNNRVLIWSTIPNSNNAPADVVVGHTDFVSRESPDPPDAHSLTGPGDVTSDGSRLFVADAQNNRVLLYSPFPTTNHPAASVVLGQKKFTQGVKNGGGKSVSAKGFDFPFGISLIGKQLFVNDFGNDRVLIFSAK